MRNTIVAIIHFLLAMIKGNIWITLGAGKDYPYETVHISFRWLCILLRSLVASHYAECRRMKVIRSKAQAMLLRTTTLKIAILEFNAVNNTPPSPLALSPLPGKIELGTL